ncbi:MAG: PAC2 family protein [Acidimicrobiales bacterium]
MHIVDGVNGDRLAHHRDHRRARPRRSGRPDPEWGRARPQLAQLRHAVVGLADRFGVRRVVGLGAYPAAVPHSRPARLTITSPTVDLARSNEPRATLDVPAGMAAALEQGLHAAGLDALTLWAQVPHYIPAGPYPGATQALVEGLAEAAGIHIETGTLGERALATRNRLDELIASEASHQAMLEELERQYDQFGHGGETLPTSDELAAEVEQFLRSHGEAGGPDEGDDAE